MKSLIPVFLLSSVLSVSSFSVSPELTKVRSNGRPFHFITKLAVERSRRLYLSSPTAQQQKYKDTEDSAIQWELFKKHHALGSWKGIWTTVDYMGDVLDETVASVDLNLDKETGEDGATIESILQTHTIAVGAKRSDCKTCFDSDDLKTFPVATYAPDRLYKLRFATCSMVNGPTLLKTGVMATELILHHADARVRVVFQHAPVWEKGVEPGQGPPQGLKLFRVMHSREALRATAPTAETEEADSALNGDNGDSVVFYRPVPPFDWHKKWAGTSWTWGPQAGNRGWAVEELDDSDTWHGSAPVAEWNLRLPGGIFLQCSRIITDLSVGLCRLAWLPNSESLLRLEAGVSALQPMLLEDDSIVGFEPPTLASLRCDVLQKMGDLEGEPPFSRRMSDEALTTEGVESLASPEFSSASISSPAKEVDQRRETDAVAPRTEPVSHTTDISDPRDALRL